MLAQDKSEDKIYKLSGETVGVIVFNSVSRAQYAVKQASNKFSTEILQQYLDLVMVISPV